MQLNLAFLEIPSPSAMVWGTLDEEQRLIVLEVLARLIEHAAQLERHTEDQDDD